MSVGTGEKLDINWKDRMQTKRQFARRASWILTLACTISLLSGCGSPNISAYADREITVRGLTEEEFTITPGELIEMECTSDTAVGQTAKAGTIHAYGPTLQEFLAHYDRTVDEFRSIKFTAEDDYVVNLGKATWARYPVIFSIANGSKPLYEKEIPMRLVIPGGKSGSWIRNVVLIEFTEVSGKDEQQ